MRATIRWACLGVVAALVLAGCADRAHPGDAQVTAPAPVDATEDPDAGPLAFTARALDGDRIDATSFAGEHVVLWMWTPW